jgi:hypothetical protein
MTRMVSPCPLRRFRSCTSAFFSTAFRPAPVHPGVAAWGCRRGLERSQRVAGAHKRGSVQPRRGIPRGGRNREQQGRAAPLRRSRLPLHSQGSVRQWPGSGRTTPWASYAFGVFPDARAAWEAARPWRMLSRLGFLGTSSFSRDCNARLSLFRTNCKECPGQADDRRDRKPKGGSCLVACDLNQIGANCRSKASKNGGCETIRQ